MRISTDEVARVAESGYIALTDRKSRVSRVSPT